MAAKTDTFDVAVFGSGPAGAATAIGLSRKGYSVALISKPPRSVCRRFETFSPNVLPHLVRLGIWEQFCSSFRLVATGIRSIWGTEEPHVSDFVFNPFGEGRHVDRCQFEQILVQEANRIGCSVFSSNLRELANRNGNWTLTLNDAGQPELIAKIVVDATGRTSCIARRATNIQKQRIDSLVGVVGIMECRDDKLDDLRLFVETCETGWWYSSPISPNAKIVVWMSDVDLLPKKSSELNANWLHEFRKTSLIRNRIEHFYLRSELCIIPANTSCLSKVAATGWFAVGDAAATIDPLSGLGTHQALIAAEHLVEQIHHQFEDGTCRAAEYDRWYRQRFKDNLLQRQKTYRLETRWANSTFWSRRVGSTGLGS